MTRSRGRGTLAVTPNRRGMRAREAVLDAAERLIARDGHRAATVSALVEEAGVPASSIYHYFGSKRGVVLAAMERGADRFVAELPAGGARAGSALDHLRARLDAVAAALERRPDVARILVVPAAQSGAFDDGEIRRVVDRVRALALERVRREIAVAFGLDAASADADRLARFALAAIVGAFIAGQAQPTAGARAVLEHLPAALVAAGREMPPPGRPAAPVRRRR